eukprot:COSAG01_NODE_1247_length_11073_cov_23.273465_9_plen_104_part_00
MWGGLDVTGLGGLGRSQEDEEAQRTRDDLAGDPGALRQAALDALQSKMGPLEERLAADAAAAAAAEEAAAVSAFLAWVRSPCLRHCVHGAPIGGGGGAGSGGA